MLKAIEHQPFALNGQQLVLQCLYQSHAAHRRHVNLRQQLLLILTDVVWLQVFGL